MIRKFITKFLQTGLIDVSNAEERNKVLVITLFSLVSVGFLVTFGIENLFSDQLLLAFILLATALIIFSNYIYLRITGKHLHTFIFIIFLTSGLFVYLLVSGGIGNSGHLWFFILPSLVYLVLGLKTGTICISILLVVIGYILFFAENLLQTSYDSFFSRRYFAAFVCVSLTALVHEYTREDRRQELLALSKKLSFLSQTDDLTGLANRRSITGMIQREIVRYDRKRRPFCLLIADIDHFKDVNDEYGHECGDQVLIALAEALDNNTKKQDIVSRWGGEEFIILLPETTYEEGIISAERLRLAIETLEVAYENEKISVTISIGLTEYNKGQTFNQIIRTADNLLYQAKGSGRNQVA
jgi:diguanylate cyclase (GGDEF)-like protein